MSPEELAAPAARPAETRRQRLRRLSRERAARRQAPESAPSERPAREPVGQRPKAGRWLPRNKWRLRRGLCGLQFVGNLGTAGIESTIRELARATWRQGYDVGLKLGGDPREGWGRTSVRHIPESPSTPLAAIISWGPVGRGYDANLPHVEFDVVDGSRAFRPDAAAKLNEYCDLICVPGENNLPGFRDHGLEVPVEVVPLGVDPAVFQPWGRDEALLAEADWGARPWERGVFLFTTAGYLQQRKGLTYALEAFRLAFAPDEPVAMLVKNTPERWGGHQARTVAELRGEHRIGLIERNLDYWSFARLLSSADVYVSAHCREGFGLVPLQALACGTPVIATAFDGPLAYLSEDNAWLIEPVEMRTGGMHNLTPQTPWAVPDVEGFARAMREAYETRGTEAAKERAEAAAATGRAWTWARSAQALVRAIHKHVGPVRARECSPRAHHTEGMLTIGCPVRNGARDLARMCESVRQTAWAAPIEVLVVDDASENPQALDGLARRYPHLRMRVVRCEAPIGCEAAREIIVKEARGDWVFQTDCDVEFRQPEWAQLLAKAIGRREVITTPLLLWPDGLIWAGGGAYWDRGRLGQLPAGHLWEMRAPTEDLEPRPVAYAPGCGWFGRHELMAEYWQWPGGYFPTIFGDPDMAMWFRVHGVEFVVVPSARVVHHAGSFTLRQTTADLHQERFRQHAQEFLSWWRDLAAHEVAIERFGPVLSGPKGGRPIR